MKSLTSEEIIGKCIGNIVSLKPNDRFDWLVKTVNIATDKDNTRLNGIKTELSVTTSRYKIDRKLAVLLSMSQTIRDLIEDLGSISDVELSTTKTVIHLFTELVDSFTTTSIPFELVDHLKDAKKFDERLRDTKKCWLETPIWKKMMELFPTRNKTKLVLLRGDFLLLAGMKDFAFKYELSIFSHLIALRISELLSLFKDDSDVKSLNYIIGIDEIPADLYKLYYGDIKKEDTAVELANIVTASKIEA